MSLIIELFAAGDSGLASCPAGGRMVPPIIATVRYTSTWRARPSPTAWNADIAGDNRPPVSKPPP